MSQQLLRKDLNRQTFKQAFLESVRFPNESLWTPYCRIIYNFWGLNNISPYIVEYYFEVI